MTEAAGSLSQSMPPNPPSQADAELSGLARLVSRVYFACLTAASRRG